jgi:predicted metalloendopeptidase
MKAKIPNDQYGEVQWNFGSLFSMVQNIEANVKSLVDNHSVYVASVARDYATKQELIAVHNLATTTRSLIQNELEPIKQHVEKSEKVMSSGSKVSKFLIRTVQTAFTSLITLVVAYYFTHYFS